MAPQTFNGVVSNNYPNPLQTQFIPPAPQFPQGMPINNMNNGSMQSNMPVYNPMQQVIISYSNLVKDSINKFAAISSTKSATLPAS
jgi:hypothetical protein